MGVPAEMPGRGVRLSQEAESFPEAVELQRDALRLDGARTGEALCLSGEAEDARHEAMINDGLSERDPLPRGRKCRQALKP